jgi:hypothetical protein
MSVTCPWFHATQPLQLPRAARGSVSTSHIQPASRRGHGFMTDHIRLLVGDDQVHHAKVRKVHFGTQLCFPYRHFKTNILLYPVQYTLLPTYMTLTHQLRMLCDHCVLIPTPATNVIKQLATSHHIHSFSQQRLRRLYLCESSHTFPPTLLRVCGRKAECRTIITFPNRTFPFVIAEHNGSSRSTRANADTLGH